jgi:D-alanine transaminase
MPDLAYVNGEFLPIREARIPIEDRGYQFADAVYEFIASYKGRLFRLEDHLDRLERSMQGLAFPPLERSDLREAILDLFARAAIERAAIYIQISRGVAPRDHAFPQDVDPQVIMTIKPVTEKPAELRKNGAKAITVEDLRWGRCDLKTVQLLPNVLAVQQAVEKGVFDAIFVSAEGIVREATSSNLFIVVGGRLHTHPLTPRILPGITRRVVTELCADMEIGLVERFFKIEELYAADEAFLTGTITEVLPIVEVDGRMIGSGRVGPVTAQLYAALRDRAEA